MRIYWANLSAFYWVKGVLPIWLFSIVASRAQRYTPLCICPFSAMRKLFKPLVGGRPQSPDKGRFRCLANASQVKRLRALAALKTRDLTGWKEVCLYTPAPRLFWMGLGFPPRMKIAPPWDGVQSHAEAVMQNDRNPFPGYRRKDIEPLGFAPAQARSVRVWEALFFRFRSRFFTPRHPPPR